MEVRDDPDFLEEVVHSDHCVEEHEEALRHAQHILHIPLCLGLEVFDAVVPHISNCSTGQGRQSQGGNMGDAVLREFLLEVGQRIGFEAMLGAGDECLAGIGADEAVAADGLAGGG